MKARLWLLLLPLTLCSACTTVRFNERERLAEEDMALDSAPLKSTLENHVYNSREGATGINSSGGGGGCGCY